MIANCAGIRLVLIPPGEYWRGLTDEHLEVLRRLYMDRSNEQPRHRVRLTRPFFVSECEVTQWQYQLVTGDNPSDYSASGNHAEDVAGLDTSDFPVENLDWFDAIAFCNALSQRERLEPYYEATEALEYHEGEVTILGGRGYRLLTDAEWEYACRGGTETMWSFGDMPRGGEANISYGRFPGTEGIEQYNIGRPCSVGHYPPNAFGLYDMHGNAEEWCFDPFDVDTYMQFAGVDVVIDPVLQFDQPVERVWRGGRFTGDYNTRSGFCGADTPQSCGPALRIARTVISEPLGA